MLPKDFGSTLPSSTETYHFQFVANIIRVIGTSIPDPQSTFGLILTKGHQKIDQSETYIQPHCIAKQLKLYDLSLNFSLPGYNPQRSIEFTIKVVIKNGIQQQLIGSLVLDSGKMVKSFKQTGNNIIHFKQELSNNYQIEYSIFIDKTRFGIEKLKKQASAKKVESPGSDLHQTNENNDKNSQKRFVRTSSGFDTPKSSKLRQRSVQRKFIVRSPSRDYSQTSSVKKSRLKNNKSSFHLQKNQSKDSEGIIKLEQKQQLEQKSQNIQSKQYEPIQQTRKDEKKKDDDQIKIIKHYKVPEMRSSRKLAEAQGKKPQITKVQQAPNIKYYLKMIIFMMVSCYLIYNAMIPARRIAKRNQ